MSNGEQLNIPFDSGGLEKANTKTRFSADDSPSCVLCEQGGSQNCREHRNPEQLETDRERIQEAFNNNMESDAA